MDAFIDFILAAIEKGHLSLLSIFLAGVIWWLGKRYSKVSSDKDEMVLAHEERLQVLNDAHNKQMLEATVALTMQTELLRGIKSELKETRQAVTHKPS